MKVGMEMERAAFDLVGVWESATKEIACAGRIVSISFLARSPTPTRSNVARVEIWRILLWCKDQTSSKQVCFYLIFTKKNLTILRKKSALRTLIGVIFKISFSIAAFDGVSVGNCA